MDGLELSHMLVEVLADKKGADILLIDIREQSIFTDFFLVCNGDNERQLRAMADAIAENAKQKGDVVPWGREGGADSGWILVDLGDVVVHLFSPEKRAYYDLEDLWQEGHVVLRMQ